jgi:hypothetical protein
MAKKPSLSVVAPGANGIAPPRPLGRHGAALWDRVMRAYRIEDEGGIELLALACQSLDRAEALREAIDRDGEVILNSKGESRVHPGIKDELANRALVARLLERLGLNVEAVKSPGRPPPQRGWSGYE